MPNKKKPTIEYKNNDQLPEIVDKNKQNIQSLFHNGTHPIQVFINKDNIEINKNNIEINKNDIKENTLLSHKNKIKLNRKVKKQYNQNQDFTTFLDFKKLFEDDDFVSFTFASGKTITGRVSNSGQSPNENVVITGMLLESNSDIQKYGEITIKSDFSITGGNEYIDNSKIKTEKITTTKLFDIGGLNKVSRKIDISLQNWKIVKILTITGGAYHDIDTLHNIEHLSDMQASIKIFETQDSTKKSDMIVSITGNELDIQLSKTNKSNWDNVSGITILYEKEIKVLS